MATVAENWRFYAAQLLDIHRGSQIEEPEPVLGPIING